MHALLGKLMKKHEYYHIDWGVMKQFFFIALQTKEHFKLGTSSCVTRQASGHSLKVIC